MASNNSNNTRKRGVDVLLQGAGKSLAVGQSCSFRLIKGPSTETTSDPVDPKAPKQTFPLVAKFPVSVVKPDFIGTWKNARLFQCDIPKPEADSEDEAILEAQKKKRWKYNRPATNSRQWVLQENEDFLETMINKRENKDTSKQESNNNNTISTRYEGVPEHNSSHYVLISATASGDLQIRNLPTPHGTIPFAQPAARQSYSLSEAEQAIQDQRMGIRTLRADANGPVVRKQANKATSKNRLLQKLKSVAASDDVEEADDIMGDVTYRQRKGGGGAARRELLSSLGDGVAVSSEGVMGGTNDAAFGGKNRFGQLQIGKDAATPTADKGSATKGERGADGAAMADDFYQRDVKAEYDELDYDANEQFDDDDVDLGEAEVVVDSGGFGAGDEDEDDELDEADAEEEEVSGAAGLATAAGFRAALAKARGEAPTVSPEEVAAHMASQQAANGLGNDKKGDGKEEGGEDHFGKIRAAAERSANLRNGPGSEAPTAEAEQAAVSAETPAPAQQPTAAAIQTDEHGLRLITQDAVQREIWLTNGTIEMKRLMKIFKVKKTSTKERQSQFRDVVKELCTMRQDPVAGRMLVLKQHYSNMG